MLLRASLLALSLVLGACASPGGTSTLPPDTTLSATTLPVSETAVTTTDPTLPKETEPKDPIALQIEELMAVTERIRGLEFLRTPVITLLSDDDLARRVLELFEEDLDPAEYAAYDALYSTLGLLSSDVDLTELLRTLETEQVLAFYDTETKELVAPADGQELTPIQELTLVHELTHALTDQHYDLFTVMDGLDAEERFDDAAAFRALVEGDAMVTEFLYLQDLSREEQVDVLQAAIQIETPVFDASPQFLQDSLLFPYVEGQEFVSGIWTADGFSGVDAAYLSYPTTTEHIYRPGTYFNSEPAVVVALPTTNVVEYDVVETSTWGFLGFQTMLAQVLGEEAADRAAEGWGGDSYRLLWDGSDVVWALSYAGDSEQDAVELHAALVEFVTRSMDVSEPVPDGGGSTFVGGDYAFVSRVGDRVLMIVASDGNAGKAAREAFPAF